MVQRSLAVGRSDDPAEVEADRVADQVMRQLSTSTIFTGSGNSRIRRMTAGSSDQVIRRDGEPGAPAKAAPAKERPKPLPKLVKEPHHQTTPGMSVAGNTEADFDKVYAQAQAANGDLTTITTSLAAKTNGKEKLAPVKARDTALQKVRAEYGGRAYEINDLVRSTIVYEKFEDLVEGLKVCSAELDWVKKTDRYAEALKGGYRDIMFKIKLKNGHIGELQMHLASMLAMKEGKGVGEGQGHVIYEKMRHIEQLFKTLNAGAIPPGYAKVLAELYEESRKLYESNPDFAKFKKYEADEKAKKAAAA